MNNYSQTSGGIQNLSQIPYKISEDERESLAADKEVDDDYWLLFPKPWNTLPIRTGLRKRDRETLKPTAKLKGTLESFYRWRNWYLPFVHRGRLFMKDRMLCLKESVDDKAEESLKTLVDFEDYSPSAYLQAICTLQSQYGDTANAQRHAADMLMSDAPINFRKIESLNLHKIRIEKYKNLLNLCGISLPEGPVLQSQNIRELLTHSDKIDFTKWAAENGKECTLQALQLYIDMRTEQVKMFGIIKEADLRKGRGNAVSNTSDNKPKYMGKVAQKKAREERANARAFAGSEDYLEPITEIEDLFDDEITDEPSVNEVSVNDTSESPKGASNESIDSDVIDVSACNVKDISELELNDFDLESGLYTMSAKEYAEKYKVSLDKAREIKKPFCPLCPKERHFFVECQTFKQLPHKRKRGVLLNAQRCLICLSTAHLTNSCPKRSIGCRFVKKDGSYCQKPHHRILHIEEYDSK